MWTRTSSGTQSEQVSDVIISWYNRFKKKKKKNCVASLQRTDEDDGDDDERSLLSV